MEYILRRVTHLLVISTWLGAAYLIGLWTVPGGVAFLAVGVALFVRALRRGVFHVKRHPQAGESPVNSEREAKYMVTQVLRNLTLIQVAYLCQDFQNRRQSRAWLKNTLPRSFRDSLDELHSNLETARMGTETKGLKLALEIVRRRQTILNMEDELERVGKRYPGHELAHPVVYVITEHLDAKESSEPEVVTLAGWNPARPALIPAVDRVALLSEADGKTRALGHAAFVDVRRALGGSFESVQPEQGQVVVYAADAVEDPTRAGVALDRVPLGFVVGVAEML